MDQIKNHYVAIISLIIAVIALLYTSWREENTEKNRTYRLAGYEVLKNLGELQIVVHTSYYAKESMGDPFIGWGYVAIISDFSQLLPEPVPKEVKKLVQVWGENWSHLKTDEHAVQTVTKEIDAARQTVLTEIKHLR